MTSKLTLGDPRINVDPLPPPCPGQSSFLGEVRMPPECARHSALHPIKLIATSCIYACFPFLSNSFFPTTPTRKIPLKQTPPPPKSDRSGQHNKTSHDILRVSHIHQQKKKHSSDDAHHHPRIINLKSNTFCAPTNDNTKHTTTERQKCPRQHETPHTPTNVSPKT